MSEEFEFDLIVIGGGSGGVRSARWAASLGAKVAICEDDRYGGTCVLRGCIPKKMMVYASHFADDIETSKDFGWDITINGHDWSGFREAREKELSRLSGLYKNMLEKNNVEVLSGRGVIKGAHSVEINGKVHTASNIIIAVGGEPWRPKIEGFEHGINSDQFFELNERPKRVVIAGGGFIGVEFACLLNHFGTEVKMVVRGKDILRGFDVESAQFLQKSMIEAGVNILNETTIEKVEKRDSGIYQLTLSTGKTLETDCIVVATGRVPKIKNLGLENAGIEVQKGAIVVDDFSQTNIPSIYAVGDVTNRVNLTPVALQEGMLVAENLFNKKSLKMTYQNIPSAVFSSPPLSTVGLTEKECHDQDKDIEVFTSSFRPLKYTLGNRQIRTFMKMIVEKTTRKVIGLHMVGDDAPEIMQGFAVALNSGATKEVFDQTIGIHPSSAEEYTTMRTPRD